MADLVDDGNDD
jgi:hypothetical protein